MKIAVVGGGWAGLAAAVEATTLGHSVTLFEMSGTLGGRARRVSVGGRQFDNGQHILIGAYSETLGLMQRVGVDIDAVLHRLPLQVLYPDGSGLKMDSGAPVPAFLKAVLQYRGWRRRDRLALLLMATRWILMRFVCNASLTVQQLTRKLPPAVQQDFIDPLCVAALNTPSHQASARVFLRVLHDALFAGRGSADLLLPRQGLDALLPLPAAAWLKGRAADLRTGTRIGSIAAVDDGSAWNVDGESFDGVVVACTAAEASRLLTRVSPAWAKSAAALRYEPIVTVYLKAEGRRLSAPMLALRSGSERPAQFLFDLERLAGEKGLLAMVVSGARDWVAAGLPAITSAAIEQARADFGFDELTAVQTLSEKRATFLCTPGLQRPHAAISRGLAVAGDYIDGPYPATLEGAVRSGVRAARLVVNRRAESPSRPG